MRDRLPAKWFATMEARIKALVAEAQAGQWAPFSEDDVEGEFELIVERVPEEPESPSVPLSVVEAEERRFAEAHGLMIEAWDDDYCPGCGTDLRLAICGSDCPIRGDAVPATDPTDAPNDTDLPY